MSGDRLALVGPFTWSPLVPFLDKGLAEYGVTPTVDTYGFGEDVAVLGGRHDRFLRHPPNGVFILHDARALFRKWLCVPAAAEEGSADGTSAANLLLESVNAMRNRIPTTSFILGTLAPPYPNSGDVVAHPADCDSFTAAIQSFNSELWRAYRAGTVDVLDLIRLQAEWGWRTLVDSRMDLLARFPGGPVGMQLLAERIAARWAATVGKMKKILVLDCDNTLWGGIVGEDGIQGIQLGEDGIGRAFSMFQESLLTLEASGTLLALCSRNNPEDIEEVFAERPEMVIPRDRITATSIGWHQKSDGIEALSKQLGLGLDSFVFVDDNPRERDEVRCALPMVTVPEFPSDPADLPAFGAELGWRWFQRTRLSDEDRRKTVQYRARKATEELRANSKNSSDFLRSLQMQAVIHVNDTGQVFRMAQLTQKTNQFNLTLKRYTESEIRDMLRDPSWLLFAGSLTDRFGDHGVMSLLIARHMMYEWLIEILLMSCRVLGRGFERVFTTSVIRYLREKNLLPIRAEYVRGPRNSQVESLYPDLGFQEERQAGQVSTYVLSLDHAIPSSDNLIALHWEESS